MMYLSQEISLCGFLMQHQLVSFGVDWYSLSPSASVGTISTIFYFRLFECIGTQHMQVCQSWTQTTLDINAEPRSSISKEKDFISSALPQVVQQLPSFCLALFSFHALVHDILEIKILIILLFLSEYTMFYKYSKINQLSFGLHCFDIRFIQIVIYKLYFLQYCTQVHIFVY